MFLFFWDLKGGSVLETSDFGPCVDNFKYLENKDKWDVQMYKKVFISHSKNDPNLIFFHKVFSGIATEAKWMEFEDITPPPYAYIKDNVNQSNAVFVLLSDYILSQSHTQNWVSFEIGLAANSRSLMKRNLDVFVFEPFSKRVDFAVPYCTYYMLYDSESIQHIKFLKELIQGAPLIPSGVTVQCPYDDCRLEFNLLNDIENFVCPSCRKDIVLNRSE